ncbi:MAG: acylneuraminate cytidylyltransferase family protein [Proteobacteria bacterium]|nr:acylneuraminate cytidylyltransferase family protein [Pseudomonadota bacterium]
MGYIAVIPARAGSKRLPNKNIKPLSGKPLIAYTINAAQKANCFSEIIVSTECPQIAEIAIQYGAQVPWLRSAEYATDTASVADAVVELLLRFQQEQQKNYDAVMLLQPTSPFRKPETILKALELFKSSNGESIVSVSLAKTHPYWCKRIDADGIMSSFVQGQQIPICAQDLPPVYQLNGLIYCASPSHLIEQRNFYTNSTKALILNDSEEVLDIDTPMDWMLAEMIVTNQKQKGVP